jgi:hypothetical protein
MSLANELRIGNWVEILGDSNRLDFFTTIQPSSFSVNIDKTCGPIPLDEDWLLKFGFKKDNEFYYILDYCIEQYLDTKVWKFSVYTYEDTWHFINTGIQYVHQLQNLYFALTGTELQFQNDKPNP